MKQPDLKSRSFGASGIRLWALLFCATLAAYLPVVKAGFIWNDSDYVTKPALQSVGGLGRIWFELGATEQYYPLLHGAFWVEHRLWGDAATGYHLLNILLHATSACLLCLVLRRFFRAGSAAPVLAAFLFALHPVGVESVAWIAEQKNTLSTVFYLLAALAYLRWEAGDRPRALRWYLAAFIFFIAGLLSKSMTATLPGALLVALWWKRGSLSWKRDVPPLAPFFAVGAAWGLFSAWVERTYVGAYGSEFGLNALERCLLAGRVAWFYLAKLVWPADLIFIYPRWDVSGATLGQSLYPIALMALVAALWLMRKRTRGPLAAVLFFLGSLFPVSGLFNVYGFIFSYVADHWQYLSSIGIMALAAGGWECWEKAESGKRKAETANQGPRDSFSGFRFPLSSFRFPQIAAIAVICGLGILTYRQSRMYNDIETFYKRTIEKNPECWMAHTNLGLLLDAAGRPEEAIAHYEQALRLGPYRPEVVHNDLGAALLDSGRVPEAAAEFEAALRLNPHYAKSHLNLGNAFLRERRLPEAIVQFGDALQADSNDHVAHNNLGIALAESGRSSEAIAQFQAALRLNPDYVQAHNNLGSTFAAESRFPEATEQYEEALRGEPGNAGLHFNLGLVLMRQRRSREAAAQFEQALRLNPDYAAARDKLRQLQAPESNAAEP